MKKKDGNIILSEYLKENGIDLGSMIAATSIWASPDFCIELEKKTGSSTMYPRVRRGRHNELRGDFINGIRIDDNTYANNAIKYAVGIKRKDIINFHACHIYPNTCYDERYHTKIQNIVLIPNSLAQLSDYFDDIKKILQYRSYELYGWYPEENEKPEKPQNYPLNWRQIKGFKQQLSIYDIENQNKEVEIEIEKTQYLQKEEEEIDKVHRKIPNWLEKEDQQINSIILITFLELLTDKDKVSRQELRDKCIPKVRDFSGNFNQMSHFGERNHAKVFEVDGDNVRLWEPIAKFIRNAYDNHIKGKGE